MRVHLKLFFNRKLSTIQTPSVWNRNVLKWTKWSLPRTLIYHPLSSKTATATTSVSSFIFLSPITIFQSHSWYVWSCLPQSSQHWSEIKEQPSVCDCTTAAHALQKKQSALRKGRVWCGCIDGCWHGCWWAPECVQLAVKWQMVFSVAQFQSQMSSKKCRLLSKRTWQTATLVVKVSGADFWLERDAFELVICENTLFSCFSISCWSAI